MPKVRNFHHSNKPTAHHTDISWPFLKQIIYLPLEYLHLSELSNEKKTHFLVILIPTMAKIEEKNVIFWYFLVFCETRDSEP